MWGVWEGELLKRCDLFLLPSHTGLVTLFILSCPKDNSRISAWESWGGNWFWAGVRDDRWLREGLGQRFSIGVPQEFLKHVIPTWLFTGAPTSFLLDYQMKNDNSPHSSQPVWMNQNYTYFGGQIGKKKFLVVLQNFSNYYSSGVPSDETGWKSLA